MGTVTAKGQKRTALVQETHVSAPEHHAAGTRNTLPGERDARSLADQVPHDMMSVCLSSKQGVSKSTSQPNTTSTSLH